MYIGGPIPESCALYPVVQDPGSDVYRKALEMTRKAPELHAELQRQLAASGEVCVNNMKDAVSRRSMPGAGFGEQIPEITKMGACCTLRWMCT